MGNKGILIVVVLIAAAAVFWLLGGADLLSSGGDDVDRAGEREGASLLEHGADSDLPAEGAGPPSRGPVLFGRAKEQRKGVGGLMGRVMDFGTGELVVGARLVVTGTGYGDESVSQQLTTDANGHFHFEALAAGDGYGLHVVGGKYQRTLAGIAVDADAVRDLGTIWLGERGILEGTVVDAGGVGIAGAQVQVHRGGSLLDMLGNLPELMEQMDRDPVPLAQAETERGGRFRIEGLDPGPINVVVRAAGFQQKMVKAVMTDQGAAGGPLKIRIDSTLPLTGIVVDERGRGVAGARVACMNQNDMDQAFFGRQFAKTDASGHFRIASPPSVVRVTVIVAAEGYPTLFKQADLGSGDLRFVLKGGAEVVLRILEAGTGRAIEGARVMAMFGEDISLGNNSTSYVHAVTDDRGEAVVAACPGKLQMLFMIHGDRGTGMYAPVMPAAGGSLITGPEDPTVKAPRTTLVFHVDQGVTIRGRVADPDGNPVAGARCQVIGAMGIGAKTMTDADGQYEMRGQSALVQMVIVTAPGYVQKEIGGMGRGGPPKPDARGEIVYDVTMLAAASLAGRVVGPDGKPLVGVRVKAGGSSIDVVTSMLGGASEGVTNAAGRYVLDGVRPGKMVRVLARRSGFLDGQTAEFEVEVGLVNEAPDLEMKRGSKLAVRVTDPRGRPLPKARVEVSLSASADVNVVWDAMSQWRNFADLRTGADGTVVIEPLPSGHVTLTATHDDHAGARKTVPIERLGDGKPTEVEEVMQLREAYTLRGRVVDPDGKAIVGANVGTAASSDADDTEGSWVPTATAQTDAEGRFAIEGMPDEAMLVHASAEGFERAGVPVATPRREIAIILVRISADTQKRLATIQKELMEIYQSFQAVKDDAERQALLKRMRELQEEQAKLQGPEDR